MVIDRICFDGESDQPDCSKLEQALADATTRCPVPMIPARTLLKTICIDLGFQDSLGSSSPMSVFELASAWL
jgi:hypothetical protein